MCEYCTQMIYLAVHRLSTIFHNIIFNTVLSKSSMKTELDRFLYFECMTFILVVCLNLGDFPDFNLDGIIAPPPSPAISIPPW